MSRLHHQQGGQPSQRMLRVAELVRHAMSELLTRSDIADPALEGKVVTIPDVRMSPDLKLATVYVMPLGGENVADVPGGARPAQEISARRDRPPRQS